ncbi:phosphatidylglycerophosphatase A [Candidatus Omnitrophota bacterium]
MNKEKYIKLIGTFFYSGYLPKAPGTWGSLATLPLIFILKSDTLYVSVMVLLFFVGRYAAHQMAQELGVEDPKHVVIDEVVGMMMAMFTIHVSLFTIVLGFGLFRLFDITKPWIIRKVERYPNGYGIMLDDIIAGVFANVILQCIVMGMK